MAISTLNDYIGAAKQRVTFSKPTSITTVGAVPFSFFSIAGNPGAGTFAGTSKTAPVKPDDTTPGFPLIQFTSGSTYISKLEYGSAVAGRFQLYDMLSKQGIYGYLSASAVVTTPLDISDRCPDYVNASGSWGRGNEIWAEVTGAYVTGTSFKLQAIYTNQFGQSASGIFTAGQAAAALTANKMFPLNLAAGDNGVQAINNVVIVSDGTAFTAGSCNVLIMRPLNTAMRVFTANSGGTMDLLSTGLPLIYNTSALYPIFIPDSTALGTNNEMNIELSNVTV